jgi:hypothetical protein
MNKKVLALAVACVLGTSMCACASEQEISYVYDGYYYSDTGKTSTKKVFETGEHIISVVIDEPDNYISQFNGHDGYKCVGMGISAYGQYGCSFGGACLLFVNDEPVEAYANDMDYNGKFAYERFGTPINPTNEFNYVSDTEKVFNAGEHILAIQIFEDPTQDNFQYEAHDGYEIIDISTTAYGKYGYAFGNAYVLYTNTVPVKCLITYTKENGEPECLAFGTPIEIDKPLEKTLD